MPSPPDERSVTVPECNPRVADVGTSMSIDTESCTSSIASNAPVGASGPTMPASPDDTSNVAPKSVWLGVAVTSSRCSVPRSTETETDIRSSATGGRAVSSVIASELMAVRPAVSVTRTHTVFVALPVVSVHAGVEPPTVE